MSAYKPLDDILSYLLFNSSLLINSTQIKKEFELKEPIYTQIIDKLIRDGYIKAMPDETGAVHRYSLTFEGKLFISGGGYEAQFDLYKINKAFEQSEIKRRQDVDTQLIDNTTRLNKLTSKLVWGTIAASVAAFLVFAWQIFLYFYPPK